MKENQYKFRLNEAKYYTSKHKTITACVIDETESVKIIEVSLDKSGDQTQINLKVITNVYN